jgi:hypothetical protein
MKPIWTNKFSFFARIHTTTRFESYEPVNKMSHHEVRDGGLEKSTVLGNQNTSRRRIGLTLAQWLGWSSLMFASCGVWAATYSFSGVGSDGSVATGTISYLSAVEDGYNESNVSDFNLVITGGSSPGGSQSWDYSHLIWHQCDGTNCTDDWNFGVNANSAGNTVEGWDVFLGHSLVG